VNCLRFCPTGTTIATASFDEDESPIVNLWNLADTKKPNKVFRGHERGILCIAYSPDGAMLASGGHDRTICVWDVRTGKTRATLLGHTDDVNSVAFSPDARLLASGSLDSTIRILRVAPTPATELVLSGPNGGVWSVIFSSDGNWLLVAGYKRRESNVRGIGVVQLWSIARKRMVREFAVHDLPASCLAISGDGARIASGSADGTIKFWQSPRQLRPHGNP
jgi:WD40 repeat protein